jgi:excisionase family DNA binding protein
MLRSKRHDIPESYCAERPGAPGSFNLRQAAKYVGISRSHLLNITKGKVKDVPHLEPFRLGRRVLFRRETLDQWLRAAEHKTAIVNSEPIVLAAGEKRANMPPEHQETPL